MKVFQQQALALSLISLSTVIGLSFTGCGGSTTPAADSPAQQAALAPFDLKISKVELTPKMGPKIAEGGKFVVVSFEVENTSNGDFKLAQAEFKIRNITENPAEQYQQGTDPVAPFDFVAEFGEERKSQLMGNGDVVHPRFKVQRILVFKLPTDADAAKYELYHEPLKLSFPLVSEGTEVIDLSILPNGSSTASSSETR